MSSEPETSPLENISESGTSGEGLTLGKIVSGLVQRLGSFGLVVIVLLCLMVLTFFGTFAQAHMSLHQVREIYFDSFPGFMLDLGLFSIPFPSALVLLSILFINLLVGGMLRMRRTWSRGGIFVIHIGIAVLLLSGLVEYASSDKGHMTLYEGQSSNRFASYYDWEVTIAERLPEGRERLYVIPNDHFAWLEAGDVARFRAEGMPFTVELRGFLANCRPRRVGGPRDGIEGFGLQPLQLEMEAEQDIAGITVTLVDPNGMRREALMWGAQNAPYRTRIGGRDVAVDFRHLTWGLPFKVTLRDFQRELHPRTGMASSFSSDITRLQAGVAQDIHISMNAPMRHGGFTFYQSGWGPPNAPPGARLFSTFSVVHNPTDQGPLVACIIIGIGLLWQFLRKLTLHIRAEAGRRT